MDPTTASRREWLGLAVLSVPSLMVTIDIFVLLLALPRLSEDLAPTTNQQLWILDAYGFTLSGFLITMGTLGDRIGRRRLLLTGASAFAAASVLAAYANDPTLLILARALMGVAGATIVPSTLALISNMFRDPGQRAVAIGVWMVSMMGGAAVGPIVGGLLLANFWWGSVFLLGVPAMVLLLVLGPVLLPEYRAPGTGRIDPLSVALSLAAVLLFVYGLKELARHGVQPAPSLALLAGIAAGVAFVRRQLTMADPLLDVRLFADRGFSTALVGMMVNTMLPGATMVLVTQYLQLVEGLDPLTAGLWMIPCALAGIAGVQIAPIAAHRVRPAYLMAGGIAVSVAGLILLTSTPAAGGLAHVVIGLSLINAGAGPLVTLGTNLVVGAAPPEKAGAAAAISQTSNELGFALGIATMGSLAAAVYRGAVAGDLPAGVPPAAAQAAYDTFAGAAAAAASLPGAVGDALTTVARAAFTDGLHVVAAISAVLLGAVAVLVLVTLRSVPAFGPAPVAASAEEQPQS
jgi:DHA2 family multidrug resistance protein-like MFS transporter